MSNDLPRTTAVIVTYNSRDHIGDALAALRISHEADAIECVVVDNASSDGTADFIAANHRWITLVRSDRNLGFGRGCNLGFRSVRTPYVLIHNPDAVVRPEALQTMVKFIAQNERAGIVAPAIIINGNLQLQAAGALTSPASILRAELGSFFPLPPLQRVIPGNPPFRTTWVSGAVMLIRSELYRSLGGFDPRFFLYFEETDLCRRAGLKGSEIWAVGEAVVHHLGGACAKSTGQPLVSSCIAEHFYRSRFYYLVKHFGWLQAVGSETLVRAIQQTRRRLNYLAGRQSPAGREGKRPFLRFPIHPE